MLIALISLAILVLVCYFLWKLWCQSAPKLLAPNAPNWVRRPNFFVFVLATLIILNIYRNLTCRPTLVDGH